MKKLLSLILAAALISALLAGCSGSPAQSSGSPAPTATPSANSTPSADVTPPAEPETDDGYEQGISPSDDIVNTTPAEKVILVVSFGTSFNQSRDLTIGGIEAAIGKAYPDYQVRRAFTSQIIIDKLAERDDLRIDNVEDAMNRLVLDKVKEVIIQPTTVMSGYEYDDVIAEVMPFADKFESFKIGKNLLADDSDYDEVAEIIVQETTSFRQDGTAVVFMGHGTEHAANDTYTKLQNVLADKGYGDYLIGTVEAEPTLDEVQEALMEMNAKKVVLRPLMIVAGDHANNDMAGDEEDSWKTILTGDGYSVETVIEGLGQIKDIQELFIKHVEEAIASNNLAVSLAASAVGVTGERIQDGTYSLEVDSNSAMFKIVNCELTVSGGEMTAVITMSGTGYDMLYLGTLEEAQADENSAYKPVPENERNVYTIPVAALDRDISCAGHGAKSGKWFDHTVTFKSGGVPSDAFLSCQIDASLTGGSGKAGIDSPAALLYKGGENIARVVWSSSNYSYMLVGGEKYLPVDTDGNSTFEIPVKLDTDMTVIACTVAMSEPKEIEYVLRFDSASIK